MPAGGLLRVDQIAVDLDLEDPASRWDESERVRRVLELFQDLGRQTGGAIEVASDCAVFDRDLHRSLAAGRTHLRSSGLC
jgi:hypothetical protein